MPDTRPHTGTTANTTRGSRGGGRNLARLAEDAVERLGGRSRLFFEGGWHSSARLAERAARVAVGLRALGVRPGDRVVVVMANCPEVQVTYTAIWRAGAVATPAIFLLPEPELRHIIVHSGAVAVVTTPEFLAKVRAAAGPGVAVVVAGGPPGADGDGGTGGRLVDLAELESHEPGAVVDRRDDDLAALLYTGGTTGRSKGVAISHENLWVTTAAVREVTHVPGVTRSLVPLPLAHAYGLMVTVVGMHATEPGVTVLMRWFDAASAVRLIEEHRVQSCALVPSMVAMLLDQPLEDHDLSSLRFVSCGAAPLSPALALEFERRVPSATVLEGYGCTESSAVITAMPRDDRRLGTVGVPLPGVEVAVVDDDGRPRPPGDAGEIVVRGPNVTHGYWNDPEQTAATFRDGWLHTGDVGRLDADGYLTIVDRKKDLIIRGGFNVFPRDVEDVLLAHPAVAAAAVVGRPDRRLGEEVVAFVTLRPGATGSPDDLLAFARENLAATKYPREIRVVDAIPLTPVGKTNRRALRERLAAETAASAGPPGPVTRPEREQHTVRGRGIPQQGECHLGR
jgi:long-chain acyl-CoA synthetase